MSVGSRIKEARQRLGMTQEQLALALGVSKGAVGNYESEATYPKTEVLYRIFDVLKCDANYIYQDDMKSMNDFHVAFPERELLKRYRALDDYGQRAVRSVLDIEYERVSLLLSSNDPSLKSNYVPISQQRIRMQHFADPAAAGSPLDATSDFEYEDFPAELVPDGADFCVNIFGNSMEPTIKNGSTVFVKKTSSIRDNDIVIAWLDGEGTVCKRVSMENDRVMALNSDNPACDNYRGHALKDMRVYGKVLGIYEG